MATRQIANLASPPELNDACLDQLPLMTAIAALVVSPSPRLRSLCLWWIFSATWICARAFVLARKTAAGIRKLALWGTQFFISRLRFSDMKKRAESGRVCPCMPLGQRATVQLFVGP